MLRWLCFWRPPCQLRVCILNLKDDPSTAIKGVLWSVRGPWLTFVDCSLLKPGQPPAHMDGETIVHRSNVAFLQALP